MKTKDRLGSEEEAEEAILHVKEILEELELTLHPQKTKIRGNYFKIANVNWLYKGLDGWTRMRLRAFKEKRKSYNSNRRISNAFLRNLGLKSLSSLLNPEW